MKNDSILRQEWFDWVNDRFVFVLIWLCHCSSSILYQVQHNKQLKTRKEKFQIQHCDLFSISRIFSSLCSFDLNKKNRYLESVIIWRANEHRRIRFVQNSIWKREILLPNAHWVFRSRVPRRRTFSFFKGMVRFSQIKFPSNRPRLLFGASYSISAKNIFRWK